MKFLADEGIDKNLVIRLRNLGYEVEYVAESFSGSADRELLAHSISELQVNLTKDKDFGELVFRDLQKAHGIVLIRLENMVSVRRTELVLWWFEQLDWALEGNFTSLNESHARVVQLA